MVDMGTIILFYHFFLILYNNKQSEKSRINTCNIHRTCTFVTNASNITCQVDEFAFVSAIQYGIGTRNVFFINHKIYVKI